MEIEFRHLEQLVLDIYQPAVEEMMAEKFPNITAPNRTKLAKAILTRAAQHIV